MKIIMKSIIITLTILLLSLNGYAQDITGEWNGILKVQGTQLSLVFHIKNADTAYSATLDSPDQNQFGIPVTSVSFDDPEIVIKIDNLGIEYAGTLKDSKITGTFKQQGLSAPLDLSRDIQEKEIIIRPQDPIEPYPYYSEDVLFENKEQGIKLAGTLTLPDKEGIWPAVVLISGSGPQNRNEELLG